MARLLPGPVTTVAQESISGRMLMEMGAKDPDFIPTIFSMFPQEAGLISLLDAKGYKTKGLNYKTNYMIDGGKFRTVSSNHIQFRIHQSDYRKEHFRANADGLTYVDYSNASYPGLNKSEFYIYLDSNYISGYDVALLGDGKTHLYMMEKTGPREVSGGVYEYKVKVDGENLDEYADPLIMQEGDEIQGAYNKYPHDFSTGGSEQYEFHGFGDAYLTLQRFKISWSGTAKAMDGKSKTGRWVQHGSYKEKAFITEAEEKMMKKLARSLDFQLFEGKGTVSRTTKKVVMTNDEGKEILSGSGLMYSGDGPIEFPINDGWSPKVLENFLTNIDSYIRPNETGKRECAIFMHPKAYINMMQTLKKMGVTQDNNIVGDGDEKVLNDTYAGYTIGGLHLYFNRSPYMQNRPSKVLKDGSRTNEWDSVVVPLGLTEGGERGIQLVQLRPMVKGTVAGIDAGGNVSSDIDGSSQHALIQNGIISQVQVIKTYKPIANNLIGS